jgi:hypothetical protein
MRFTLFTPNCFSNCERNLDLDDDVIYVLHDVTKEVNAPEIQGDPVNLEPEPPSALTPFTPDCFSNCKRNLDLDDDVIYVLHDVTKEVNALEIQDDPVNLEPEPPSASTLFTPDCFSNCKRNLNFDDDVIYVLHDVTKEVNALEIQDDPVNLEPEPPSALTACPRILTANMMHQLMEEALPVNLKTARWDRIYALGRDGDDFDTMTHNCANFKNTIIVAVTTQGHILGGYAAAPWVKQEGYNMSRSFYGNGESFLFASHPAGEKQQDHPAEEHQQDQNVLDSEKLETQATSEPENKEKKLHIYKWSGGNTYSQVCDVDDGQLAMGGGGAFGLLIQDNFSHGTTGRCSTFGNPPLVPRGIFEIVDFEVYGFTSLGATQGDPPNEHQALLDQDTY